VENDLYVKSRKYQWKIKKVEFLGVVIGLGRIKIVKVKVKGMLNWPIFKEVKDV